MLLDRRFTPLLLLIVLGFTLPASASGPTFWTVATASDLIEGTSDGVYISLAGDVTAGPPLTNRMTSTPAQIWSVTRADDGTLWAGTGGDGRVIRMRPGQPEETVFNAPEANIFAVALSGTRIYAASSPDGKVYVIEGNSPAREFFDPTEKYIWALSTDAAGRLWVGAGNPAVIYRVSADGTSQIVHRPPSAHVVSLSPDSAGRMLAGTESPGRLYRFDAADRPFVMLDTGMSELRAISTTADGVVFAAGVAKGSETASGGETTSVAVTLASTATTRPAGAASGGGAASGSSSSSSTPRRSVIYRFEPDGRWEEIWTTADVVYDLAAQANNSVLVATGPEGRLYFIDSNLDVALFTGVDARQITAFAPTGRGSTIAAFATANPGRVIAVGAGEQSPARYTSAVRDTESIATWGILRWDASGSVELQTRSGNTSVPDDSWSEWSGPYRRREGEVVTSPTARFIQWRAVLARAANGAAPPKLSAVTLAYLPRNNRPVVSEVTTYPMGVVFIRPFVNDDSAIAGLDDATVEARRPRGETAPTPPSPTRRVFQKGLQTITWKADDGDDDQLFYTLQYRREGVADWQDLKTDLTTTTFVWDTTTAADGRYVIRVRASDSGSNTSDRALVGTRESDPVEVDNTVPTIAIDAAQNAATTRLVVVVRDGQSAIERLEYSVRGGEWRIVYPADGLADSPEERYEITLPENVTAGDVMLRTADRLQNSASAPGAPR